MSEQTASALRAWFRRVEPLYPELFNTAYAICGCYDQAEFALRSAIVEVWLQSAEGGIGFREKLRGAILEESLRLAREDDANAEFNWPGLADDGDDPLMGMAVRERVENQRLLMLRHGVGLSPGRIAAITDMSPRQVRAVLNRFEARCRRRLPRQERARFDASMARALRRQLNAREGIPHPAAVYRAFEAEASNLQMSEHRISRFAYRLLVVLLALMCALLFWLFAVLVQPPELEHAGNGTPVETIEER